MRCEDHFTIRVDSRFSIGIQCDGEDGHSGDHYAKLPTRRDAEDGRETMRWSGLFEKDVVPEPAEVTVENMN